MPVRLLAVFSSGFDTWEHWPQYAVALVGGFLGQSAGNHLAPRVSEAGFRWLILLFLLYGGLTLVTAGTGALTLWLIAAAVLFGLRRMAEPWIRLECEICTICLGSIAVLDIEMFQDESPQQHPEIRFCIFRILPTLTTHII